MRKGVLIVIAALAGVAVSALPAGKALAAGAVEMQVEHIVVQAIDAYNDAMEAGDPAGWVKYFTDNARRHDPLGDQHGKAEFAAYYEREFKTCRAKIVTKKFIVSGRTAAVVFVWDAMPRPSGGVQQVEMVGIFELASSGRFDALSFYFDTPKALKLLAASGAAQ